MSDDDKPNPLPAWSVLGHELVAPVGVFILVCLVAGFAAGLPG